jgi:hypothetical protein
MEETALNCEAIQEMLAQQGGRAGRLDTACREHLEACPACQEVAAGERALGLLLSAAVPPADPRIEEHVMASIAPARVRRRAVAFLPVAVSFVLAAVGAFLVGGVPGLGVVSFVPSWSADGWAAFVARLSDWSLAVAAGARASASLLDPAVVIAAGALGLLGLAGVAVTALRWRKASPWRRPR